MLELPRGANAAAAKFANKPAKCRGNVLPQHRWEMGYSTYRPRRSNIWTLKLLNK
jgi:hypothetical protein